MSTPDSTEKAEARRVDCGNDDYLASVRSTSIEAIKDFFDSANQHVLIAAGPPGTGKTCTITRVLQLYQHSHKILSLMGNAIDDIWVLLNAIRDQFAPKLREFKTDLDKIFARLSTRLDEGRNLIIFIDEFDLIFALNETRLRTHLHLVTKKLLEDFLPRAKLIASVNEEAFIEKWFFQFGHDIQVVHFRPYISEEAMEIAFLQYPQFGDRKEFEFAIRKIIKKRNGDLRQVLDFLSKDAGALATSPPPAKCDRTGRPPPSASRPPGVRPLKKSPAPPPRGDLVKRQTGKKTAAAKAKLKAADRTTAGRPPGRARRDRSFCRPGSSDDQSQSTPLLPVTPNEAFSPIVSIDSSYSEKSSDRADESEPTAPTQTKSGATELPPRRSYNAGAEDPLERMQASLGAEYMSDVNKIVFLIRALPPLQQLICATICVLIDRVGRHKGLKVDALYNVYRDLGNQNLLQEYISRTAFDGQVILLAGQNILTIEKTAAPLTPVLPQRLPRSRTPMSKQRQPARSAVFSEIVFDFPLDLSATCVAFGKLKAMKTYGFTMCRMTATFDSSD